MGIFTARDVPTIHRASLPDQIRAPKVATQAGTSSTSTFGLGLSSGGSAWTDEEAWKQAYYANVWVYRCAQVIAEDLATLPLRVGANPSNPGEYALDHPLAVLLGPPPGTPNPTTSARRLWLWTIVQRLITGKFAWEIEYGPDSGLPMFLWPLPSSRITPIASKGGGRYFDGYEYDTGQKGSKKILRPDNVVYDYKPSATDWRESESVLQAAKLDVSVAVMQDRYDHAFLKNDARPASIVVHEMFDNVEERDAWRAMFTATHGGPDNAGKIAFAEASPTGASPKDSMLIQTLGMTSKDAQMVARYDSKLRSIEVAFGVPRSRLGDASGRTYSNAGEEWGGYWQTTVKNLAWDMADAINTHLAPKFGQDVAWFDFSGNEYLRDAPSFGPDQAAGLKAAGIVTLNEVRAKVLNLPPVDGGDALEQTAVPPGSRALQSDEELAEEVSEPEVLEAEDVGGDVPDAQQLSALGKLKKRDLYDAQKAEEKRRVSEAVRAAAAVRMEEDAEERKQELWRVFDKKAESLEERWIREFDRLFKRQMDSTIQRLEGKRGRQALRETVPNADAVYNQMFWLRETEELAEGLYEDVLREAVGAFNVKFKVPDFDINNPWAKQYIQARVQQLSPQVNATTYNGIKAAMTEGAQLGESIPKIAERIEGLFTQTYANRSTVVARTEVISAYNGGTVEMYNQTPDDVIVGMEWLATSDDRTREAHALASGQKVRKGAQFNVMGESLAYPGDPSGSSYNVIQCRCTTIAITDPKELD